jgi:hypothetical protein
VDLKVGEAFFGQLFVVVSELSGEALVGAASRMEVQTDIGQINSLASSLRAVCHLFIAVFPCHSIPGRVG